MTLELTEKEANIVWQSLLRAAKDPNVSPKIMREILNILERIEKAQEQKETEDLPS